MDNVDYVERLKDYKDKVNAQFDYILEDYASCPQPSRKEYIKKAVVKAKILNEDMTNDDFNTFKNKEKNQDFELLASLVVIIKDKLFISNEKAHEIIDLLDQQRKINFILVNQMLDGIYKASEDKEIKEYKTNIKVKEKDHQKSIMLYKDKIDNKKQLTLQDTIRNVFGMRKKDIVESNISKKI